MQCGEMKYNFPIEIKLYFGFDVFKNKLKT